MLLEYPLNEFPSDIQAEEGMELHMNDADGNVFPVRIAKVLEESVILDANHTLAGEDLIFDLELISIEA
jgi:FKBP-type peptidyl-prolyl cis-trans isomerase 2